MKAMSSRVVKGLHIGSVLKVADNSGAKLVRVVSVKRAKSVHGRQISCGVSDLIKVSVKKGNIELKKQVHWAVVIRQRKEYKRNIGDRICFEDNAAVLLKDDKGNPQGTQIKGPVAKEVIDRWPFIAKIAGTVV